MPALFAVTLFLSAALLFLVQPMIAKMILPKFGGTPAVWNTCMVFFQAMLLAGYSYAHMITQRWTSRRQAVFQAGLLLLGLVLAPFLLLPIGWARDWAPPGEANPIPWLLGLLAISVGFPFLVLSTMSPLLQKWFAATGHPSANDPYFLYSASNLGSLLALLGYPLLVEPNLRLVHQGWLFVCGYAVLFLLTGVCALQLKKAAQSVPDSSERNWGPGPVSSAPTWKQRLLWTALAFVPSSLLLGVTTYLSMDVAPIPLIWVVPLALYLLTFVLVFGKPKPWLMPMMGGMLTMTIIVLLLFELRGRRPLVWGVFLMHLTVFFSAAMICHGKLFQRRPPAQFLTDFYLCMSLGGVLGGLFNALVVPFTFTWLAEYPLAIALACILGLLPGREYGHPIQRNQAWRYVPIVGCGVAAVGLALSAVIDRGDCVFQKRSFYGIHSLKWNTKEDFHDLFHGIVLHGRQSVDKEGRPIRSSDPLTYYHPTGPIGQVFKSLIAPKKNSAVALVGLGAGSLAAYGQPGQHFTFYEIDPVVQRIARNPDYFTYLQDCRASLDVVLGDARLSLAHAPASHYDLIVVDAFSSDAIPVHLMTREAVQLYLTKLSQHAILAFHTSNLYLDLPPVLAAIASDAQLACFVRFDTGEEFTDEDTRRGKLASQWVLLARTPADLGALLRDPRWKSLKAVPGKRMWTDDFSNLLDVLEWKG